MKLIEKIKLFLKNDTSIETPKFIIAQKSCPHCASRGMFIFNSGLKTITESDKVNEKNT